MVSVVMMCDVVRGGLVAVVVVNRWWRRRGRRRRRRVRVVVLVEREVVGHRVVRDGLEKMPKYNSKNHQGLPSFITCRMMGGLDSTGTLGWYSS